MWCCPGLINTHHHFYQTLTRAVPAALDRELFPWLQALYPIWARLTPEALDLGIDASPWPSCCCPAARPRPIITTSFPAGARRRRSTSKSRRHKRLGLRVLLTRGSMNLSQRDGGLPPDSVVQDEDTILADSERLIARYHDAGEGAMVQIALAPCSPFSVTTSLMRATADLARRLDVRMHTHLAETEDENRFCQETPQLPAARLSGGLRLAERSDWLAHGIHFNAAEIARLARAGTTVAHCPCSNQTLASGACPVCAHGRGRRCASGSASTARPRTTPRI